MEKTADYTFAYKGSDMYMRIWEGEEGSQEKPVVVIEPGRGVPFDYNRVELANDLAKTMNTTAENIEWYEQSPDGKLKEYQFKPYEVEHRPYTNEMTRDEYEAAEKEGHLKPNIITGHHAVSMDVSGDKQEALKSHVGELVESYEQQQNRDFAAMKGPSYEKQEQTQEQKLEPSF